MKTLKLIGYYALWLLYYIASLISLILIQGPYKDSQGLSAIKLFAALIICGSPFLLTPQITIRLYPGNTGNTHNRIIGILVGAFTGFFLIGTIKNISGPFDLFVIGMGICWVISLLVVRPKGITNETH